MTARYSTEWVGAAIPAPTTFIARLASKANPQYPVIGIGSTTEYAAYVIAARCRLSPAVARKVVELVGIGGDV